MRERKYRIWIPEAPYLFDEAKDGMFYQENQYLSSFLRRVYDQFLVKHPSYLPFQIEERLMDFIGLHDKNGKEVYERDVVKAWSQGVCGTFEIRWRQSGSPCWILYPAFQSGEMWRIAATEHKKGKEFINVDGSRYSSMMEGYFDSGIEVIGNIHENPELIKTTTHAH